MKKIRKSKKNGERKRKSRFYVFGAVLAMIALLFLFVGIFIDLDWNRRDNQAGAASDTALAALKEQLAAHGATTQESTLTGTSPENTAEENASAGTAGAVGAESAGNDPDQEINGQTDLYSVIPEEIPRTVIEDVCYMGILTIPALGLELPVIYLDEWEPEYMDIAPCTYSGSLKRHDLVIMAHNYQTHFLGILNMQAGQEVILSTVDGMTYTYVVTAVDVMHRSQKEKLYEGKWDLTLFTCVPQTYNRCAVRCELVSVEGGK